MKPFHEDRVAEAIKDAYPERAVAIWRKLAEREISQAKPKAYEQAAGFLLCIRRVMHKTGQEGEWQTYLVGLRQTHYRKKSLMEILERFDRRQSNPPQKAAIQPELTVGESHE